MKKIILLTFAVAALILTSCSKDEVLYLEITVTTLPSEKWSTVDFEIQYIRLLSRDLLDSTISVSSLQRWNGVDLNFVLDESQEKLIADTEHWEQNLVKFDPRIADLSITKPGSGETYVVEMVNTANELREEAILLEDGKRYALEMIFDFDNMIFVENGKYYCQEYELVISEL